MGDDMQQDPNTSKPRRHQAWMLTAAVPLLAVFAVVFFLCTCSPLQHRSRTQKCTCDLDEAPPVEVGEGSLGTAGQPTLGAPDPIEQRLQTYPPPPCRSHGFVRWEDGSPASGAEIITLETRKHGYTQNTWVPTGHFTDEMGHFRLPHQESCSVRLGAVISGKGRGEELAAPVSEEEEPPYVIRRDIVLDDAVRLHGVVVDEMGEPVPGAAVCASLSWTLSTERHLEMEAKEGDEARSRMWANATSTDPSGVFEFPALEQGEWTILVEADDYGRGNVDLLLDQADPPEQQKVVMGPDTCWHIVVQDEDGVPIEGATVEVKGMWKSCDALSTEKTASVSVTGSDGVVEECDAEPSDARFTAIAPGKTLEIFYNKDGDEEFAVTLPASGAVKGKLTPFSPEDCPCQTFTHGFYGADLEVEEDGSFYIDHVADGATQSSFHTQWGSWMGTYPRAVQAGEVVDLGVVELKKNPTIPSEIGRQLWGPLSR